MRSFSCRSKNALPRQEIMRENTGHAILFCHRKFGDYILLFRYITWLAGRLLDNRKFHNIFRVNSTNRTCLPIGDFINKFLQSGTAGYLSG